MAVVKMEERRKNKMNETERDLLIRVDQNITNLVVSFREHAELDQRRFDTQDREIALIKKSIFIATGGVFVFVFLIKMFVR